MNNTIKQLAKIVCNSINEAFDFNEVDNNNSIIDDGEFKKPLILKSFKAFVSKYFDYNLDIKEWDVHYNHDDNYFIIFPKDYEKYVNPDEFTLDFVLNNVDCVAQSMYVADNDKQRKYCVKIYNKISKEFITNYTHIKYHRTYTEAPFYSHDFIIYHNSDEIPPLIYIKPTKNLNINVNDIPNDLYFSTLFVKELLKKHNDRYWEYTGNVDKIYEWPNCVIFKIKDNINLCHSTLSAVEQGYYTGENFI